MKKIKTEESKDLSEMFNQMIGAGNIEITYPKYQRIFQNCNNMVRIFRMLGDSPFMKLHHNSSQYQEVRLFCTQAQEAMDKLFSIDLSNVPSLAEVHPDVSKKFGEAYIDLRRSRFIQEVVLVLYRNLAVYKKYLTMDPPNHNFIKLMPGAEWRPFPFTKLNLKYILTLDDVKQNTINFFMVLLQKVHELTSKINDELNSPDIDIDQFVEVIMTNIDAIQKVPELSRCGQAFKKIKESVKLLKSRFDGYYQDYIATNDSTIMMQHFILDVSKETTASPQVTLQFKKIINYYTKVAHNNPNATPQIKNMLNRFNDTFNDIEKKATEDLVDVREVPDEDIPLGLDDILSAKPIPE